MGKKKKKAINHHYDAKVTMTEDEIKKLPYRFQQNHCGIGWNAYRAAKNETAIKHFHLSAACAPDDKSTLLGRGNARTKMGLYEGAIEDAWTVLGEDDMNKDAILLEAVCSNFLGTFEQSLLMYRRGINKRGRREVFVEGQNALEATLENTVGRHSGAALTELQPFIEEMKIRERKQRELDLNKKKECLDELTEKKTTRCGAEAWYRYQKRLMRQEQKRAKIYLEKLSDDREWCKQMMNSVAFKEADEVIQEVKNLCSDFNNGLDHLFHNLYARRPLYHFKHRFKQCSSVAERDKDQLIQYRQKSEEGEMQRRFDLLRQLCKKNKFRLVLLLSDIIKNKLNETKISHLPEKNKWQKELCDIMCGVYLGINKLRPDLTKEQNRLRINCLIGLDQQFVALGLDSLVQSCKFPFLDFTERMTKFKEYIKSAKLTVEKAWLHYEVARLYFMSRKWDYVVQEASKCSSYAIECQNKEWSLLALILIIQGEVQRKDKAESLKVLKESIAVAEELRMEDTIAFLMELRNVVEQSDEWQGFMDIMTVIRKREDHIIKLIKDDHRREKMRDIFARMRALPPHRKMSILPGVAIPITKRFETSNRSIIPGGLGGRLGLHPITNISYQEFLNLPGK